MHGVPCMLSTRKQPSAAMPVTDHKPLSLSHGTPWAIGRCGNRSIKYRRVVQLFKVVILRGRSSRRPQVTITVEKPANEPSHKFRLVGDTACWARLRQGSAMICTRILLAPGQSARLRHCSPI
jgi:hypothetical protein